MVQVSEEGEKIHPVICGLSEGWADILFSNFSEDEKEMTLELLQKMAMNVSSHTQGKKRE